MMAHYVKKKVGADKILRIDWYSVSRTDTYLTYQFLRGTLREMQQRLTSQEGI